MYARILKFLTNLLFKQVFMGFLTKRKKREPLQWNICWVCGYGFRAFNKRQYVCVQKSCIKIHRANEYRRRLERKRLEANKATIATAMDSPDLESEE